MFFAAGIVFLDRFGITYLFPDIGKDLHLNNSQLAALVSVTAVAWAVSSLIFAIISDRIGRKKWIIISSLVLFSICVAFVGFAPNFGAMLALRALIGFFEGPALPIIQSAIAAKSAPQRRGRNLGIVIAGTGVIGGALAPSIMIGLASAIGWRGVFPFVAVPGIIIAILVAIFYKEEHVAAVPGDRVRLHDFGKVVANRNVLLAVICSIVLIGEAIGFQSFATEYLAGHGLNSGQITLVLTVAGITGAIGSILSPVLSDRIGRKPALMIASAALVIPPLAFLLFTGSFPLLIIGMLFQLLGGGALTIATYVVPSEAVPFRLVATAFAVQIAVGETLGGALGPQIGGAIADATHNLGNAMIFYAAIPVIVLVVAFFLKETAPRRVASAVQEIEEGTRVIVP
jgi:MFS family permease